MNLKNKFKIFLFWLMFLCILASVTKAEAYDSIGGTNEIPIAMATDNNYVYGTVVAMTSALENKNENSYLKFYIMVSGTVSEENKNRMKALQNHYKNCSIELIDMKDKFNNTYITAGHITTPTYYRLCLSSLLPEHDKILYLDGDIIVRRDLWEFYNIDISDYYIGGIKDYALIAWSRGGVVDYPKRLGVKDINQYINAGILSMNLQKIRKDNLEQKFSDYLPTLKSRNLYLNDQDVLNATCYDKIKFLSPEYNAMQHFEHLFSFENMPTLVDCYDWQEWKKACVDPTIVHYSSPNKPWGDYRGRFYSEWNRYREIAENKIYPKIIKEGTYNIFSALADNKSVDINGCSTENKVNVQLWESNSTNAQKFKLNYVGEGYYEIEAICSGKVLDVEASGKKAGTRVIQHTRNNGDNQKWMIKDAGDGYYYLVSKCNGLYMDVAASKTANGTKIHVWDFNGTNAQKFKFREVN